ncbi:MAG: YjbH domain-containing protein [Melioribacteraceae bacterium]
MKYLIIIFFATSTLVISQTISGFSGLFTIPDANLFHDGTLNFSFHYLDKKYVSFGDYDDNAIVYSATLNFLPFLEVNTNFVYLLKHKGTQGIGDRSVGFRIKFLDEGNHFINLSTGINNIGTAFGGVGAIHKQSIYIVASKKIWKCNLVIGHGFKVFKAADYQFIGLFGGISLSVLNNLELITEYDAERFNSAVRLTLLKHIKILAGLMNLKDFSGGISYSMVLE